MLQHCPDAFKDFQDIDFIRIECDVKVKNLFVKADQQAPVGANENFMPTVARYAVFCILHHGSPKYLDRPDYGTDRKLYFLEDNQKILIAEGDKTSLDVAQEKHRGLINILRRDPEIKGLVNLKRQFPGLLKRLENHIGKALTNLNYLQKTFCPECPK